MPTSRLQSAVQTPLRKSTQALHRMNSTSSSAASSRLRRGTLTSSAAYAELPDSFDLLRGQVKRGSEFAKELATILSERAELEASYSKALAKLSAKLFKGCREMSAAGTVSNSWHFVAEDMEATAETHKSMAARMTEDLVKPLKMFVDTQYKNRKTLEGRIEKRGRAAIEWRGSEIKAKSKSYTNCRENERVQDQVLDAKLGRGRVLSEKELLKLEAKKKKSEEAVRKSDLDYYACCLKAERAR